MRAKLRKHVLQDERDCTVIEAPFPTMQAVLLTPPGMIVSPPAMLEHTFETPIAKSVRFGSDLRRSSLRAKTALANARTSTNTSSNPKAAPANSPAAARGALP